MTRTEILSNLDGAAKSRVGGEGPHSYSPYMLTLRDHETGDLFDPWAHLGQKRRHLLDRSWAGVFRSYLLRHLPVSQLTPHFREAFGRPTKELYAVLGALILQQLHDLTDAATVEAVAFHIDWHYALDIRCDADAYLCERTLRNYRALLIAHEMDMVVFRTLTDRLIASVGADSTAGRCDSSQTRSSSDTGLDCSCRSCLRAAASSPFAMSSTSYSRRMKAIAAWARGGSVARAS